MSYYKNSYSAGDTFIDYSGNKYTVVTGGNTPSTPFDSSNIVNDKIVWGSLELTALNQGGSGISTWTAGTQYNIGDNVIKDNILYQCLTANSDSTWTPANWQKIGDEVFIGATSSTSGEEGIVPQPTTSDISKFLCGDGTWKSAGGNGLNISKEILWSGNENTATPTGTTLSLTNNYTDYDYLLIYFGYNTTIEDTSIKNIGLFDCSSPYSNFEYVFSSCINSSTFSTVYADISFSGVTWKIIKYVTTISDVFINKIVGIKFLPNPNNYSTTEQEIGIWIDGKKLYQVTLSGTIDSSINSTTRFNELPYNDLSSYNIDTVVDIVGGCYNSSYSFTPFGKFQLAYATQFYEDNRSVLNVYTDKDTSDNNKLKLYITSGNWYVGLDYFATIKYTKV